MVRIVIVESAKHKLPHIGAVIAIGILKQQQVIPLSHIDALGSKLEPRRQMQFVSKNGIPVGLSIAICILEDDKLVVRFRIPGSPVRVGGHRRYPKPPSVVERHLHWISKICELLL